MIPELKALLLLTLAIPCAAQNPCANQDALQSRYDALQAAYWRTNDLPKLDAIRAEQKLIGRRLTACNMAQIQANTVALEQAAPQLGRDLEILGLKGTLRRTRWWHFRKRAQIRGEIERIEGS